MKYDFEQFRFIEIDINPNKIAIRTFLKEMTWGQLYLAVNSFAEVLKAYNLPKDVPIIIVGDKEIDFVVSILACLKNNRPYLPVDHSIPELRIEKYRDELDIPLIVDITNNKLIEFKQNKNHRYKENLAYFLFTSGSSGEPKSVQISRTNLSAFSLWLKQEFSFSDQDEFLNQASLGFDLSLFEFVGFLNSGGCINLTTKQEQSDELGMFQFIKKNQIHKWISTPSFIERFLLDDRFNTQYLPSLNEFIFCGEELTSNTVRRIFKLFPKCKLNNSYGPTETTVAVSNFLVTINNIKLWENKVPIGISNKSLSLNDESEILIKGNQVSLGYFNRVENNLEQFIGEDSGRLFKTGDYAEIVDDHIYFSGRQTNFVKLHGHRLSLNEISFELEKIIKNGLVVTVPFFRKEKIVKIVSFVEIKMNIKEIEKITVELAKKLAPYMMPSKIISVESFPMTSNHKTDIAKLKLIYLNS